MLVVQFENPIHTGLQPGESRLRVLLTVSTVSFLYAGLETVKTVPSINGALSTGLKPGVNESFKLSN